MITYREEPDGVVLEMEKPDFNLLVLILGYAAGAAHKSGEADTFRTFIQFANAINRTNPHFRPYAVEENNAARVI